MVKRPTKGTRITEGSMLGIGAYTSNLLVHPILAWCHIEKGAESLKCFSRPGSTRSPLLNSPAAVVVLVDDILDEVLDLFKRESCTTRQYQPIEMQGFRQGQISGQVAAKHQVHNI